MEKLKRWKRQYLNKERISKKLYQHLSQLSVTLDNDTPPEPVKGIDMNAEEWKEHLGDWLSKRISLRKISYDLHDEITILEDLREHIFKNIKKEFKTQITHENPDMDEPEADVRAGRKTQKFLVD